MSDKKKKENLKAKQLIQEAAGKAAEKATEAAGKATQAAGKAAQKATEVKDKVQPVGKAVKDKAEKEFMKLALKETYIQYEGNEYSQSAILKMIEEDILARGGKLLEIKALKIYIKPEDNAAYYVLNDTVEGKVQLS